MTVISNFPLSLSGACMCASGIVGHAGWLPSVPGCGWRYSVSSYILHPFLLLTGHCHQRAAPCSQSGSAGWDRPSDTHTGHKGMMNMGLINTVYCHVWYHLCLLSVKGDVQWFYFLITKLHCGLCRNFCLGHKVDRQNLWLCCNNNVVGV